MSYRLADLTPAFVAPFFMIVIIIIGVSNYSFFFFENVSPIIVGMSKLTLIDIVRQPWEFLTNFIYDLALVTCEMGLPELVSVNREGVQYPLIKPRLFIFFLRR